MSGGNHPQPATLEQFIKNQGRELDIKEQELRLQFQQDQHSFEFAKETLAVKRDGLSQKHGHDERILRIRVTAGVAFTLIVAGVIGYAMYSGNKDIAMELTKSILFVATGGIGGYGLGRMHPPAKEAAKPE